MKCMIGSCKEDREMKVTYPDKIELELCVIHSQVVVLMDDGAELRCLNG